MNVLVLGGTTFVGPHLVDAALRRGHAVTVFHRGTTPFAFPPDVTERFGDRTTPEIEALASMRWDAVVDTSGYEPEVVERSAHALRDAAARYLFVSTISVYRDLSRAGATESNALHPAEAVDDADPATRYGARKSRCESTVARVFGDRATVVRPGLIVGPYDPTDRFTYWVERLLRGGAVLAPGRPSRLVQYIDVRDLTAWMVRLLEDDRGGTYHATGRETPMETLLRRGTETLPSDDAVRLEWVPDDVLVANGIGPWVEMPLWIPEADGSENFMRLDIRHALANGLDLRDTGETFRDTAAWVRGLAQGRERKAGLTPERERCILELV